MQRIKKIAITVCICSLVFASTLFGMDAQRTKPNMSKLYSIAYYDSGGHAMVKAKYVNMLSVENLIRRLPYER